MRYFRFASSKVICRKSVFPSGAFSNVKGIKSVAISYVRPLDRMVLRLKCRRSGGSIRSIVLLYRAFRVTVPSRCGRGWGFDFILGLWTG